MPPELDWRRVVRRHPIPSLLVAAAAGYWLGRSRRGRVVVDALAGVVATGLVARVGELPAKPSTTALAVRRSGRSADADPMRMTSRSAGAAGDPTPPRLRRPLRPEAPARRRPRRRSSSRGATRPDAVVLSGDLTQRAKPAQFRAARAGSSPRIAGAGRLVVPGNHDVPLYRVLGAALRALRRLAAALRAASSSASRAASGC